MVGNLVIVESPAKAKTIQKFLGEGFVVKSSFGHIRDLQDNRLSIDIENGFKPEYVIPEDKKKVVDDLRKAAEKAGTVWLASDEDREGEAISWHLSETLGLDPEKTKRIVFHEITKNAIVSAVQNPRTIDMNLVHAQQARRVLDRLVGFELSPVLWKKIQRGLSAGRVQSVALRLVVDREKEIMAFRSEPFYKVEGNFSAGSVKLKGSLDTRFSSIGDARAFLEDSKGAVYTVASVETKDGTRSPSAPFTTSTLQQEAARKLHFPVSVTMRVAQGLYEKGLITYMRTDSTNLSNLALNAAKVFICDNFGAEYSRPRHYRTKSKGAQEAHEAIRPTYIENDSIEGTSQEQKLYHLIWKRTVASQMSEAQVSNTQIRLDSDRRDEKFTIQASKVLFDGFLKLYIESTDDQENEAKEILLPDIKVGEQMKAGPIEARCNFTQPPFRYSEASLVKKLEELGIGRPSTYAPTITTLTTGRGYLVKGDKQGKTVKVENLTLKGTSVTSSIKNETIGAEKGKLMPQEIGMIVTDYLVANFADILDYDFTANVETDFDKVAAGKTEWNTVISKFYSPFHKQVDSTLSNKQYSKVERVLGVDPADGLQVVARFGQYGPYVQKGDAESKQYASLQKDQLIETITLEEALKLFALPRNVGSHEGHDVMAMKGRFGPYLKWGGVNVSLPKGTDPLTITLEDCIALLSKAPARSGPTALKEFEGSGISVMSGMYGPYLKKDGQNYKLPKGTDTASLTEEACLTIIAGSKPTVRKGGKYKKNK